MARRSHSRFIRPQPRTKMWINAGVDEDQLTASSEHLLGVLNAAGLALRPFTILRTRMLIDYRSDQIAASEGPFGKFGMIVVTDTASGIGVTAVPSTNAEPEASWFVYEAVASVLKFSSAVGFQLGGSNQYVIDSKAMRKVGADDDIVLQFAQVAAVGALITTQGRMLIQLH